jgi:hypothetical protein
MINRVSIIEWSAVYAMHAIVSVHGLDFEHSKTDKDKR